MTTTLTRRTAAFTAATVLAVGLAACSGDGDGTGGTTDAAGTETPGDSTGTVPPTSEAPLAAGDTPPEDPGPPQISADKTQNLVDGEQIIVTLHGLDTSAGYYLAICREDTGADAAGRGAPPECTGDRSASKWIAPESEQRATDHFDAEGNAEVTLTVAEKGDAVDCSVDTCVLKLFGDHANEFRNVGEAPVTFAD
ncbi:hypothetical protein Csp1_22320 [Corynebacterium provencense]|jgi:hypothetical protein|uniref:Thiamine biosynthesis protein X n=1 Tax=Corynebacterium provencense TaxID=1737425 RepID=A0A2Z3YQ37_9CORY|nr:thiamine biosynthesis protein [Corynebacterium provencense]AWT26982.1 hypothetical protein Csp1_22320 [Corynebacterium provencense]MCI1255158.1 thiamine biosynthesis protein [Corynebacterium provencense]